MSDFTAGTGTDEGAPGAPSSAADLSLCGGLPGALALLPRVAELARTHRLGSVAAAPGAEIAAAFAAAAEYGRERGGFAALKALPGRFERELDSLRPRNASRPLWKFLFALERHGRGAPAATGLAGAIATFWSWLPPWMRWTFDAFPAALREALPLHFWIATLAGCVVGGTMDVLLANGLFDASHPQARTIAAIVLPVMFIGSYVFSVGACTGGLLRRLLAGRADDRDAARAVSHWLHEHLQALAGLDAAAPPLTPAMLRAAGIELAGPGEVPLAESLLAGPSGPLLAGSPPANAPAPGHWARVIAYLAQCGPGVLAVTPRT